MTILQRAFNKCLVLCACLLTTPAVIAAPYSDLYIFGDSLSDTGNLFRATTSILGQGIPSEPYSDGRFSNGSLWVEYLAPLLGLTYNADHNFAWAGAESGEEGVLPIPENLQQQIDDFITSLNHSSADADALYIIWVGANDILSMSDYNNDTINSVSQNAVNNILTAVGNLYESGARNLLLMSLPDIGSTPRAIQDALETELSTASTTFNQLLISAVAESSIPLVLFDVSPLLTDMVSNPSSYGFSNVTDVCYNETTETSCGSASQYLYWDAEHPTTRAHEFIANRVSQSLLPNQFISSESRLTIPWLNVVLANGSTETFSAALQLANDGSLTLTQSQTITPNGYFATPATYNAVTGLLVVPDVFADDLYYQLTLQWQTPVSPFHVGQFEVVAVQALE